MCDSIKHVEYNLFSIHLIQNCPDTLSNKPNLNHNQYTGQDKYLYLNLDGEALSLHIKKPMVYNITMNLIICSNYMNSNNTNLNLINIENDFTIPSKVRLGEGYGSKTTTQRELLWYIELSRELHVCASIK